MSRNRAPGTARGTEQVAVGGQPPDRTVAVDDGTAVQPAHEGPAGAGAPAPTAGMVLCDDGVARPRWAAHDPELRRYHDEEWGRPVTDERELFEALSLEAFQAGLSWATVLRKRPALRAAFDGFDPEAVAKFTDADVARLMADRSLIRNEPKIRATISNAAATLALREEGGLVALVWQHEEGDAAALAKALRRRGFRFLGPTTVHALMQAVGVVSTR